MRAAYAYSMLGAMASSFSSSAFSNASSDWWTGPALMNTSVEPHHTITSRSHPFSALKRRMSSRSASAHSRLLVPGLTLTPSSFLT